MRSRTAFGFSPGQAGATLLAQTIKAGIATTFDQTAFPGPLDPWAHAITPKRECALWRQAQPQLGYTGLYDLWMFGGQDIPHWTAFTICYHIVSEYCSRHPNMPWHALTSATAATILAGSHPSPAHGEPRSEDRLTQEVSTAPAARTGRHGVSLGGSGTLHSFAEGKPGKSGLKIG
jgi:hypothetical protein